MLAIVVLALVVLGALAAPEAAAAGGWRPPVPGEVVTPFAVRGSPYAAGQHRGVDLAAPPATRVRAACSGTVRFAGRLPGSRRAVSLVCGGLVASHLDLRSVAVRRGARVRRGAVVGVAAGPSVHLGARRIAERHGYVDPLGLLGADRSPRLGPAPVGRAGRWVPRVAPVPVPARRVVPSAEPAPVPPLAWAGLALLAGGLPLGGLVRARRRRLRRGVLPPTVAPVRR